MVVVSDTTTITYLIQIGHLPLLGQLYGEVVIPIEVFHELARRESDGAVVQRAGYITILDTETPVLPAVRARPGLDYGEAAAISLALVRHADLLIVDDGAARKAATALRIDIIGLLGVLGRAKELGYVTAVRPLADRALAAGYRIRPSLYQTFLASVGESAAE